MAGIYGNLPLTTAAAKFKCLHVPAEIMCIATAAMMDFVNPGLLGSLASFKRIFEGPITKGRDRNATAEEQQLGKARTRCWSLLLSWAVQTENALRTASDSF